MTLPEPANKKLTLDRVREQFEHWRRTRKKRGAIPEVLWEAAVSLHPEYSLCQISKVLRLGYNDLKHRVQAQRSTISLHSSPPFKMRRFFSLWDLEIFCQIHKRLKNRLILKGGAAVQLYFPVERQRTSIDIGVLSVSVHEK